MATVIGIFENCFKKIFTCCKTWHQSRRFTHIDDTIKICYFAWKNNLCRHYSISHKPSILQVANFLKKNKILPKRSGERYASALTNMDLSNRVYKYFGRKN